jgi:hypothetical protein
MIGRRSAVARFTLTPDLLRTACARLGELLVEAESAAGASPRGRGCR